VIAYVPGLAPQRIVFGLVLLLVVAGLTWFGHGGRLTFAVMTLLFIASAVVILVHGFVHAVVSHGRAPITGPQGSPWTDRNGFGLFSPLLCSAGLPLTATGCNHGAP
jgi:hypothetical protein